MAPVKFEATIVSGDSASGKIEIRVPLWLFTCGITMGQKVEIEMKLKEATHE